MNRRSASSTRRAGLASLVLALALAVAACGGGGGASGATVPPDADLVVRGVEGLRWDQPAYTVAAGEVLIAAENVSSLPHNLHIVGPGGVQLPQFIDIPRRGEVRTMTVTLEPGEYTLICTVPGHNAMRSTLTVTG